MSLRSSQSNIYTSISSKKRKTSNGKICIKCGENLSYRCNLVIPQKTKQKEEIFMMFFCFDCDEHKFEYKK